MQDDRAILQAARDHLAIGAGLINQAEIVAGLDKILARTDATFELRAERFDERPLTIKHHRGLRTDLAKDWTPRDLLIECLRSIDAGEQIPREALVVFQVESKTSPEETATVVCSACSGNLMALGLLSQATMIKGS